MLEDVNTEFLVKGTRGEYRIVVRRSTEAGRTTTCFDVSVPHVPGTKRVYNRNDLAILIAQYESQIRVLWENIPILHEIEDVLLDLDI